MDDQTPPTQPEPEQPTPPPQRRLERSPDDRMISGVCGGIARYLGVDTTLVRIVTVGLVLLGGAGVLLYLAALLLMPEAGAAGPAIGGTDGGRAQALTVLGVVVLAVLAFAGIAVVGAVLGWILFPLAFLVIAGLFAWWIASGERPAGSTGEILKRAALGLVLLAVCFAVALGGAWATGSGSGAVGAGLVIGAGAVLVAAAFARPARWLILPALALGLSAGFVAATGIDLDGGVGDREYRPAAVNDIRDSYQIGVGEMIIDLRDVDLPAGDKPIKVKVGVGHAALLVREDVCVMTNADVGVGAVDAFDRESSGVDVSHDDERTAPAGTPRVIVDGDVGVGLLEVNDHMIGRDERERRWDSHEDDRSEGGNEACITGRAGGGDNG
jgi:phage shock protein PspC (stress-responsive transcriptional regulator)